MRRFFSVILIVIAAVSLTLFMTCTVQGIKRNGWTITSAEITFVGLPDGIVYGEFEDPDGNVHSEMCLYTDGKFMPRGLIKGSPWVDPEPYYCKMVRIIYDPAGLADLNDPNYPEDFWRYCESFDLWLRDIVVSGILIAVSAFLFVMLNKKKNLKQA